MHKARDYASVDYWEERFKQEDTFEWLQKAQDVTPVLDFIIRRSCTSDRPARVLVAGCGNSSLSAALHDSGSKKVVSSDFSEVVLERMRERHRDRPEMEWVHCNMLGMDCFADSSFDAVVDKCTLDALSCAGAEAVVKATNEFHRVLTAAAVPPPSPATMMERSWGGVYCLITYTKYRVDDFLSENASYTARDLCTAMAQLRIDAVGENGCASAEKVADSFVSEGEEQDARWHLVCCLPFFSEEEHDNGSVANPSNAHYLLVFTAKK